MVTYFIVFINILRYYILHLPSRDTGFPLRQEYVVSSLNKFNLNNEFFLNRSLSPSAGVSWQKLEVGVENSDAAQIQMVAQHD